MSRPIPNKDQRRSYVRVDMHESRRYAIESMAERLFPDMVLHDGHKLKSLETIADMAIAYAQAFVKVCEANGVSDFTEEVRVNGHRRSTDEFYKECQAEKALDLGDVRHD